MLIFASDPSAIKKKQDIKTAPNPEINRGISFELVENINESQGVGS